MVKVIVLSIVVVLCVEAAQVELGTIEVEAQAGTEVIKDVSGEDINLLT